MSNQFKYEKIDSAVWLSELYTRYPVIEKVHYKDDVIVFYLCDKIDDPCGKTEYDRAFIVNIREEQIPQIFHIKETFALKYEFKQT
jgi:hypothetical protein